MQPTINDFSAILINGQIKNFTDYYGKVLLIANTASMCGFTKQYNGFQALYNKYKGEGLAILAFPCNQFGNQEPGTNEQIEKFCKEYYGVTFDLFAKIDVNGDNAHPVFKFLKEKTPGVPGTKDIKWNFTKFIVNAKGKPTERFSSMTSPEDIIQHIDCQLNKIKSF